jgi:hypothetical protein
MNDSASPNTVAPTILPPAQEAPKAGVRSPAYEPPLLVASGSLRDVLGKTGKRGDFGFHTHKP